MYPSPALASNGKSVIFCFNPLITIVPGFTPPIFVADGKLSSPASEDSFAPPISIDLDDVIICLTYKLLNWFDTSPKFK